MRHTAPFEAKGVLVKKANRSDGHERRTYIIALEKRVVFERALERLLDDMMMMFQLSCSVRHGGRYAANLCTFTLAVESAALASIFCACMCP